MCDANDGGLQYDPAEQPSGGGARLPSLFCSACLPKGRRRGRNFVPLVQGEAKRIWFDTAKRRWVIRRVLLRGGW